MAEIIDNKQIAEDIYALTVLSAEVAEMAVPGQFAHIRVRDSIDPLLRRPISICAVDPLQGTVRFVFRRQGTGTRLLASLMPGQTLDLIAPLGGGTFPTSGDFKAVYVIGGGIGVPPLLYAAKVWHDKGIPVHAVLGFAGKDQVILEEEYKQYASVSIYTVDGSYGKQGLVTDYFASEEDEFGGHSHFDSSELPFLYLACGPKPMLKAVKHHSALHKGTGYLSLEEHMACGIGACMGCVTKIADRDSTNWEYTKICDCGPVFPAEKVVL